MWGRAARLCVQHGPGQAPAEDGSQVPEFAVAQCDSAGQTRRLKGRAWQSPQQGGLALRAGGGRAHLHVVGLAPPGHVHKSINLQWRGVQGVRGQDKSGARSSQ